MNGSCGSSSNMVEESFALIVPVLWSNAEKVGVSLQDLFRDLIHQIAKLEDNSRYFYEMKIPELKLGGKSGDEDSDSSGITYKRYRLSDEKTFETLSKVTNLLRMFADDSKIFTSVDNPSDQDGLQEDLFCLQGLPQK